MLLCVLALSTASLALNVLIFEERTAFSGWMNRLFSREVDVNATAFYLLPFRVFELGLGASLVFLQKPVQSRLLATLGMLLGGVMIAASFVVLNEQLDFPSYNALLPCIGAALIILFGAQSSLSGLLSNRVMVGVGLISYSLYLVHWPIIVFYTMTLFQAPGGVGLFIDGGICHCPGDSFLFFRGAALPSTR